MLIGSLPALHGGTVIPTSGSRRCTVIYSVLCWGGSFRTKHIVFHNDNNVVFQALNNITIKSKITMDLLHHFLNLACWLNFTFSSIWLPSAENSLADTASHFSYAWLFLLTPYLNKQLCLKCLWLNGTIVTPNGPKLLCSIYGMDLLPAHVQPTSPVSTPSSPMSNSTAFTTLMAPSCHLSAHCHAMGR